MYSIQEEKESDEEEVKPLSISPVNSINTTTYSNGYPRYSYRRRRMILKTGNCNVAKKHAICSPQRKLYFHFRDLFTSIVELRWRWLFVIIALYNVFTWILFACFWWVIAYHNGDIKNTSSSFNGTDSTEPCVNGVFDFHSSLLYSMETHTTMGYGTRAPTINCHGATALLMIECIFGAIFNSITLGIVFTKAAMSKARRGSIIFSDKAVICLRDGRLCLLFRIADVRKSRLISTTINAWLVNKHRTIEGEYIGRYLHKLQIKVDDAGPDVCLLWPVTACHVIDKNSPLFEMSALDLMQNNVEVIVSLTGTLETTGQLMETRSSYISCEIMWGHRFSEIFTKPSNGKYGYIVDYRQFQKTFPIDTPVCSAKQFNSLSNPNSPERLFPKLI